MNSIVVLCILGVMFSQQAEGCNPYAETTELVDPAKFSIAYLYNHIAQVKFDFTMKVIQMKMNQTTRIYSIMFNVFTSVWMTQIKGNHNELDVTDDCKSWYWGLYRVSLAATMELTRCVKKTSDVFKPMERNIEEFLDARTHCLLNLDDVRAKLCRNIGTQHWEECVAASALSEFTTNTPLTCKHEAYITKLKELENNASLLSKTGKDDVSRCLEELEGKYNDTIKPITEFGIQCFQKLA